ncbi:MAG: hypothetical protein WB778_03720 [Thermoplasmata archaeon]
MRLNGLALATVLFVVLTAFVVFPGMVRGVPTGAPSPAHPAATISIQTVDEDGIPQTHFYSQTGFSGSVYFEVTDTSPDTSATVTITDQNATRDGVASPAISWKITLPAGGTYDSVNYAQYYQIPVTVPYGGNWNISVSATLGGTFSTTFSVQTYAVSMYIAPEMILPAHTATATFLVEAASNAGPYTKVTSVVFGGTFLNTSFEEQPLTPTVMIFPAGTASGTFEITIPKNADPNSFAETWIYANVSIPGSVNTTSGETYGLGVAELNTPTTLFGCAECSGSAVPANAQALVGIDASQFYNTYTQPAIGLQVAFHFQSGTTPLTTVPGNPPTTLMTNSEGIAEILFNASPSVFLTNETNHVIMNVTDPLNSAVTFNFSIAFTVIASSVAGVYLNAQLSQAFYYAGDVATVNWQLGGDTSGVTNGWSVFQYQSIIYSPESGLLTNITGSGALTGTSLTGSFTLQLPVGLTGVLEIAVFAHNATQAIAAEVGATVTPALIVLYSSVTVYNPGQTVTFTVVTDGSVFTGATLTYALYAASGFTLQSGVLSGSSFSYTVPSTAPTDFLFATVIAQNPTLGVVGEGSDEIQENIGYQITAGIQTKSNYADNSYQPGQSVTLSYNLQGVNGAALPSLIEVGVAPTGLLLNTPTMYFVTSQTSGTFQYTIPSNTPTGTISIEVGAYLPECSLASCFVTTNLTVYVNSNPSVLNMELGAGSGLTVGWLILLIVAVLLFLIALFFARRWSRRAGPPGPPMAYIPPTPAEASATSTAPAGATEGGGVGSSSYGETTDNSPPPLPPPSS